MTYAQACILYYKWLGKPGSTYIEFIPWYHGQGIEIEPDKYTKRLIKLTGYKGSTIAQEIINYVVGKIAQAITQVQAWIDDVKRALTGTIHDILNFFVVVWDVFRNLINTIANIVSNIVTTIGNVIKGVADWIVTTITLIVDKINGVVADVYQWIKNLYEHTKEAVIAAFTSAIDTLKVALESVKNWIKTVATNIWEGIKAVGKAVSNAFQATIAWVKDKIAAIIEGLKTVIVSVKDWIVGVYESIGKTISGIIEGIKEGFKTGLDAVILFMQDLWIKITALLDSLFDLSVDALTEVFVSVFSAQKIALQKLMAAAD